MHMKCHCHLSPVNIFCHSWLTCMCFYTCRTHCHSQVLSQKELCDERVAAAKLDIQKKMKNLIPPPGVSSQVRWLSFVGMITPKSFHRIRIRAEGQGQSSHFVNWSVWILFFFHFIPLHSQTLNCAVLKPCVCNIAKQQLIRHGNVLTCSLWHQQLFLFVPDHSL